MSPDQSTRLSWRAIRQRQGENDRGNKGNAGDWLLRNVGQRFHERDGEGCAESAVERKNHAAQVSPSS
jgi:hypothetical protein